MVELTCQDRLFRPEDVILTRRQFLSRLGMGFGALSLTSLIGMGLLPAPDTMGADLSFSPFIPRDPHFTPKAKRVLHIFASGAPSHIDTWDPKPALDKYDDKSMPGESNGTVFASPFKFAKSGKSGIETSEVFPMLSQHVDELAVIRSMYTDIPDHAAATIMMNTGSIRFTRPSVGSWVTYGLGSENQNLPGFIALSPGGVGARNLQSAFLPGAYQGTSVNTQNTTIEKLIENIKNSYVALPEQRRQLDLLHQLNEVHSVKLKKDGQLEARLQAYEMAYQMQIEATDAFDISKEPENVRTMYGADRTQGRQDDGRRLSRQAQSRSEEFHRPADAGAVHRADLRRRRDCAASRRFAPLRAHRARPHANRAGRPDPRGAAGRIAGGQFQPGRRHQGYLGARPMTQAC